MTILLFFNQILISLWFIKRDVNASVIPKYKKFDAYMKACNRSGALAAINEYDRLAEVLSERDLSFEVDDPFTREDADNPSYKGCEPMKRGRKPVKCNVDSDEEE